MPLIFYKLYLKSRSTHHGQSPPQAALGRFCPLDFAPPRVGIPRLVWRRRHLLENSGASWALRLYWELYWGRAQFSPSAAYSDAPMGRPGWCTADVGPRWDCQGRPPPAPQHRAPGRNTGCASLSRCSAGWRTVTESILVTFS